MSRAAAFRLLCGCLSRDCSPASHDELTRTAQRPSFAWETFLQIAGEALVAPAILGALRSKTVDKAFPQEVIDFFDGVAVLNRQRNERLLDDALEIAAALNQIDVVPVFLKGAAHLLSGLYPDLAERMTLDIDVLVPADRLSDCVHRLHANGFQELLTQWDFSGHHHHPPLGRPGGIAVVELHREPLDAPYRQLLSSSDVFGEAIVFNRGGATFAVPSGQSRLVQAIAHPQLADQSYLFGNVPLRELLDFARLHNLFAAAIDWHRIARRFASSRARTALGFHLLAAERLFDVPIAPSIAISRASRALYRRALWQVDHQGWLRFSTRVLRPYVLLRRSLSHPVLRQRLVRSLGDGEWYRRQWQMLWW
jgi:hypothetical protein